MDFQVIDTIVFIIKLKSLLKTIHLLIKKPPGLVNISSMLYK